MCLVSGPHFLPEVMKCYEAEDEHVTDVLDCFIMDLQ